MSAFPMVAPIGVTALLVRFADRFEASANRAALAFRADLERDPVDGIVETAPSLTGVLVRCDPAAIATVEAAVARRAKSRDWSEAEAATGRTWIIPAAFEDAPDLGDAAREAGTDVDGAIAALSQPVRVLTLGFAPGQPYLGLLDAAYDLPRRTELVRVPKAAVVLAVRQLVLFAADSPTGWRHVAQTAFSVFRPGAETPFPLAPGDAVRFVPVPSSQIADLRDDPAGGARVEAA